MRHFAAVSLVNKEPVGGQVGDYAAGAHVRGQFKEVWPLQRLSAPMAIWNTPISASRSTALRKSSAVISPASRSPANPCNSARTAWNRRWSPKNGPPAGRREEWLSGFSHNGLDSQPRFAHEIPVHVHQHRGIFQGQNPSERLQPILHVTRPCPPVDRLQGAAFASSGCACFTACRSQGSRRWC